MKKKVSVLGKVSGSTKELPKHVKSSDKTYAKAYREKIAKPKSLSSSEHLEKHKHGFSMIEKENKRQEKEYMSKKKVKKK